MVMRETRQSTALTIWRATGGYLRTDCYFHPGWSYSVVCRGSASYRRFDEEGIIGHIGVGVFCEDIFPIVFLQSHATNYMLRALGSSLKFEVGTVALAPIPFNSLPKVVDLGQTCE